MTEHATESSHKMDAEIGETRLDRATQGIIGKGAPRYEGPLKVSGQATYAYEYLAGEQVGYGFIVPATIGKGKIVSVDVSMAEKADGVRAVIHGDTIVRASAQPMSPGAQTIDGQVFHYGQPVAFVVADSFEQARHAAKLVKVDYALAEGRYSLEKVKDSARKSDQGVMPPDTKKGDFETAFAVAEVQFDETYTTPPHHASAMEPHASTAKFDGEKLTIWSSCQLLETNIKQIAKGTGIDEKNIRLLSPYIGGGFGSKLGIGPGCGLRRARREGNRHAGQGRADPPERLSGDLAALRNDPARAHRLRQATAGSAALGHETIAANSPGNGFFEPAGISSVFLYEGDNRLITHRLGETDVLMTSAARAPGEAVGMLAFENAMDEMAERLGSRSRWRFAS